MDPCVLCGDTSGDCRCSLPTPEQELDYADFMICDQLKDRMVSLLRHLGRTNFLAVVQGVIKQAIKEVG